ncbi:MAG: proton-conducting transporter membrane subunit [Proteobacteria bacterium]|nr:proton-conducting transporter membrane subunit [Pseudomonadota bacterium]
MTQAQFLLLFLVNIPLIGIIAMSFVKDYPNILSKVSGILVLIFMVNLAALFKSYHQDHNITLSLFNMSRNLDIGLAVNSISLMLMVLIALIWFALTIYSGRYFVLSGDGRVFWFRIFTIISVEFIILILFSKNLLSLFLFYQALIFTIYFSNTYFMHQSDVKASYNFTFILLVSSFAFFLAIILTYKLTGRLEFSSQALINNGLSWISYTILVSLYLIGIAIIAFVPIYLLYGNLYYLISPVIITSFIISYGLISLFILFKVINNVFGLDILNYYNQQINYGIVAKLILAVNLIISAAFCLLGRNLKKILIYLFFNQLIFAIFSFFIFALSPYPLIITIASFILSQVLIFFCIGNINLYLLKSKEKSLKEIFWQLKLTISFLIFALLNIIGVVPTIGFLAKYHLLKEAFADDAFLEIVIIFINIILNIICITKIIQPMLSRRSMRDRLNHEVAKEIEFDSGLLFANSLIVIILLALFPLGNYITASLN